MNLEDLPLELRMKILGSDNLPDLVDLARVRAVSHAMRDAVDNTGREISEKTCSCCAAKTGCLSTLQNQLRRGRLDEAVGCEAAALGGHLEILRWARANDCPWNERTSWSAAGGGHLKVLKWLRENGCPWDEQIGWLAAQNGHMDVLRWAHDTGCPLTEWTFALAADGGRLHVLRWLHARGCPLDARVCEHAARGGSFDALMWLRSISCPWDRRTCAWAATSR